MKKRTSSNTIRKSFAHTVMLLVVCFSILCCSTTRKESLKLALGSNSLGVALNRYFTMYEQKKLVSGYIRIIDKFNVIYENSFDHFNLSNRNYNAHTKFKIGSITKMFTAYLCLIAEDKGLLSINDSVVRYLPDTNLEEDVKIHHLLSNTSGIPDFSLTFWYLRHLDKPFNEEDSIEWVRDRKLKYLSGENWSYSNLNFVLLGLLLEHVTNSKIEEVYDEWIFQPLNMENTGFGKCFDTENIATPNTSFVRFTWSTKKLDYEMSYTAGNIYSTAYDLNLWLDEILGSKLISQKSKEKMQTKYSELFENVWYGYGCYIEERQFKNTSHTVIGHSGGVSGFGTMISVDIENELKIIVLTNVRNLTNVYLQEQIEADCYKIVQAHL